MRSRTAMGWLIGLVSTAVSLGVGELVAAFVRPESSPIIAVGNRVVVLTPQQAKSSAIDAAGQDDKALLIGSILLLLAVLGGYVGVVALRNPYRGLAGVLVLGVVGGYCALTANAARGTDVVPTAVGTLVGAGVLLLLVRAAGPPSEPDDPQDPQDPPEPQRGADRRTFLYGAGAAAGVAAATGFGGRALQDRRFDVAAERRKVHLPASVEAGGVPAGADVGKSGVPWRTPNRDFYRIDTALTVPQVSPGDWKLRIHGMVDRPITLTYDQLLARPLIERWITLCCVSNKVGGGLVSNSLFRGARLADLLREAGVHPDSDQLVMRSVDGMTIGAPTKVVMDGRDALLAIGMNGAPLPVVHGFPVRVVVPGLYGYISACKWVVDLEATTYSAKEAYWTDGGWAAKTDIKVSSRIDRPASRQNVSVGEPVVIAGVAWHQHVGIDKVEVQVDDGPWRTARLAKVPSTDTWRQWVLAWTPQESGPYQLRVRATDANGVVQDEKQRDVFPSGATGLDSVVVNARI